MVLKATFPQYLILFTFLHFAKNQKWEGPGKLIYDMHFKCGHPR